MVGGGRTQGGKEKRADRGNGAKKQTGFFRLDRWRPGGQGGGGGGPSAGQKAAARSSEQHAARSTQGKHVAHRCTSSGPQKQVGVDTMYIVDQNLA